MRRLFANSGLSQDSWIEGHCHPVSVLDPLRQLPGQDLAAERFPEDFRFQLTAAAREEVVTYCDHLRRLKFSPVLPWAFTEHGSMMAASVLNQPAAVEMSLFVVRAFVHLRDLASTHAETTSAAQVKLVSAMRTAGVPPPKQQQTRVSLPIRITLVAPPAGVAFCVQGRDNALLDLRTSTGADLSFDVTIQAERVGAPRFFGDVTQGPRYRETGVSPLKSAPARAAIAINLLGNRP